MKYDRERLEFIIRGSSEALLKEQPMLFQEEHDINERTVSGELSAKIKQEIAGFHVNAEYNRMTDEFGIQIPKRINLNPADENPSSVYPDIIIHRQEDGDHNLLIIEIKMSWKNAKKKDDIKKIGRYMSELGYKFGLYLELGRTGITTMEWFQ